MSGERPDIDADAHILAEAASKEVDLVAYLNTGGSSGCALCADRTTAESVEAGHVRCAEERIAFDAGQRIAREIRGGDLWIRIARALEDPRLFQWLKTEADR